jgi:hypothetical protein
MISINLEASNRENWTIQFYAEDDDTGNAIDFTGATINFALRDSNRSALLSASTADGNITTPTTGLVEIAFTETEMSGIDPGTYSIGCNYTLNSVTAQLFVGYAAIYDGVVDA